VVLRCKKVGSHWHRELRNTCSLKDSITQIIVGADGVEVDWQVLMEQASCSLVVELGTGCRYALVGQHVYGRVSVLRQRLLELDVAQKAVACKQSARDISGLPKHRQLLVKLIRSSHKCVL
jgi:hypothetical protein